MTIPCRADINRDGFVDGIDSDLFMNAFETGDAYYVRPGHNAHIDDDAELAVFEPKDPRTAGCRVLVTGLDPR